MVNIFLFHGAYGDSDENWFPWLRFELEQKNCVVIAPDFPTPERQSLDGWHSELDQYLRYWERDSVAVGHSTGAVFLLRVLEKTDVPIEAAFLVSGFTEKLGIRQFDSINETFIAESFDWKRIKENCKSFYVFHGEDDPYVPDLEAMKIAENLGTTPILIPEGGHLNAKAGFTEFPELLEKVLLRL